MNRFMTFVNGSNLFTNFKHLDVFVDDYEALYRYIFTKTVERWRTTISPVNHPTPAINVRVYWHVVDVMEEWDLRNSRTRLHLQERFMDDRELRAQWAAEATRHATPENIDQAAFTTWYDDLQRWYEKKLSILGGMSRFYHAVESSSDFIEVCRCGRWKVDLLRRSVVEKGLDVCFAVDLVGMQDNYDTAIIVAGDSEGVPSMEYIKSRGKQVAVIEILKGAPPAEGRPRGYANNLKLGADFVVPVYESELIRLGIADKGDDNSFDMGDNG
ncbi:MAG: NYN domain-containing protein [bacterium]